MSAGSPATAFHDADEYSVRINSTWVLKNKKANGSES